MRVSGLCPQGLWTERGPVIHRCSTVCGFRDELSAPSGLSVHGTVRPSCEHTFYARCKSVSFLDRYGAFPHRCAVSPRSLHLPLMAASAYASSGQARLSAASRPLPPQNLEAEEYVLGAMMLSAAAIEAVSDIIDAGDFYRESHVEDLPRRARALPARPPGRRDHRRRQARRARRARGGRRQGPHPRDRDARPRHLERRPPRADRARDGDAARADGRRREHPAARLGPPRRDARARRPRRADGLRPRPAPHPRHVRAHRGARQGELRADHADVRVRAAR